MKLGPMLGMAAPLLGDLSKGAFGFSPMQMFSPSAAFGFGPGDLSPLLGMLGNKKKKKGGMFGAGMPMMGATGMFPGMFGGGQ